MINLIINRKEVSVKRGTTILDAAKNHGIEIPTMCHLKNLKPFTSCMVCVVKVNGNETLIPACGTQVTEGMNVETNSKQVLDARKTAIELLLSEHAGDCIAPCQRACPLHIDIPLMIRMISEQKYMEAYDIITPCKNLASKNEISCWQQCEKACRRKMIDSPLSIFQLEKFLLNNKQESKTENFKPSDTVKIKSSSIMRKIVKVELQQFLKNASKDDRIEPLTHESGYCQDEAGKESARCLHCDCRKKDNCKLRDYTIQFSAQQTAFKGKRIQFNQLMLPENVIFESGKCIKCGICTEISKIRNADFGFTFLNRGFNTKIGIPFNNINDESLKNIINECAQKCPTGALAFN